jgi:hypothetical protein
VAEVGKEVIFAILGAGLLTTGVFIGYNMGVEVGKKRNPLDSVINLFPRKLLDPVVPGEEDDFIAKGSRSRS